MYEHYGDDFLLRMRGMFALAIHDKRSPDASVCCSHAINSASSLCFMLASEVRLIFASEIKALLASGLVAPEIDPVALRLLLTHGAIVQPHTILRGVKMLLPGSSSHH